MNNYNRIFVTHIVPKKLIEKLNVSAAANYFSYNLIDNNLFNSVISLIPTNINKKMDLKEGNICFFQSRFINNNGIFKLLNVVIDNFKLFFAVKNKSNVWFYNLTNQTVLSFLLLKYFKRNVNLHIILLDYTPSKYKVSMQYIIFKIINNSKGVISLTKNPKLTNKNKVIIPGVVPSIKNEVLLTRVNYKFLLSGLLSKSRLPELMLDVFSQFPEYELIITGVIQDNELIKKYINKYDNIKFLGLLEFEEYLKVLREATFSINSRDPNFNENNFNFPSKTIEHLRFNKIIISTMNYSELEGINYLYVKPEKVAFVEFLNNLKFIDSSVLLLDYANQSEKVDKLFGVEKWKQSMEFLEIGL